MSVSFSGRKGKNLVIVLVVCGCCGYAAQQSAAEQFLAETVNELPGQDTTCVKRGNCWIHLQPARVGSGSRGTNRKPGTSWTQSQTCDM